MTTVATWNVGDGLDKVKLHGLVKLHKAGADIICLQECGDRGRMLDEFCDRLGWRMYRPTGIPGAASVPILWNPATVRAVSFGTRQATSATKVGSRGAGPATMKPKVWNRLRVADSGLVVINGHVVPSVYLPQRRRLARAHLKVLAEMVARRKDQGRPVVAVGDFNMLTRDPLTKPLRKLGMVQRTNKATHGRRTIDHVWTLGTNGRVHVLSMPSDHHAVLFTAK